MISISNEQNISIDVTQIERYAATILNHLGYQNFDLGILLTDNKAIHAYNLKYRDKDKPTDILSFPFYPDLKAGEKIISDQPDQMNLGDIVISPEYVQQDLARWNHDFEKRMKVLLVHGICHLLGYDHIEDEDYEVMKKKEEELLSLL